MSETRSGARGAPLTFEGTGVRQVRATALGRGTHGVPDVRRMVESQFHIAFPHRVWVAGEVGVPLDADDGLRFALHPSTGDDVFSLPCLVPADGLAAVRALLHRTHDADLEDVVREGRLARVGGLLRYDSARGAVVFVVSELDPTPTALELAGAREAARQAVAEAALAERQRARTCRTAPLEVAVVGAQGDVALDRVRDLVAASPYDVDLRVHPVVLTGPDAPTVLASAVQAAGAASDVVLLVRSEGRPLALASYDALEVAEAVAASPVPVVAALGGAGTRTAVDEVAWASSPGADDAVRWLLGRLHEAQRALDDLAAGVAAEVEHAGERCRAALDEVRDDIARAGESAAVRADQVRRRRRLELRIACAAVVVAVVAASVALDRPLLLLALLLPVLALTAVELWWRAPNDRRTRRMSARDDDFTQVLARLQSVREELRTTVSPERVAGLRELATELVADGERLLGVHLRPAADGPAPGSQPTADAPARRAELAAPDGPAPTSRPAAPDDPAPASQPAAPDGPAKTSQLATPVPEPADGGAQPAPQQAQP